LALGFGFFALEFVTGHSKIFDVCVPPRKAACAGKDQSYRDFSNEVGAAKSGPERLLILESLKEENDKR